MQLTHKSIKTLVLLFILAFTALVLTKPVYAEDCWIITWEACCNGGCDGTSAKFEQIECEITGKQEYQQVSECRNIGVPSCVCDGGGGTCSDGQWDTCGSHGCGGGDSAYCDDGVWTCVPDPATCNPVPPPPSCTATAPNAAALISPADKSTISNTNGKATLVWNQSGTWGTGCPQANRYILQYKVKTALTCAGGGYTNRSVGTATSATISGLSPNTTYCWRVVKTNGSLNTPTAPWEFTTPVVEPYLISLGGSISAWGGFTGFSIPNRNATQVPNLTNPTTDLRSVSLYLSSYAAIAGTSDLAGGQRISRSKFYTTGYQDNSLDPKQFGNFDNWYDLLFNKVEQRGVTVRTITGDFDNGVNKNLANALGVNVGAKRAVVVTGNLTISQNSICNFKGIIFVQGVLDITPNLTRTSGNGCIFVAERSARIRGGAVASYDVVQAFIITDITLITTVDNNDSLYVLGGAIAKSLDLRRTGDGTESKPREVFEFDPFYADTFRDIFTIDKFSIRER